MTLQEAKDQVAVSYGYYNWNTVDFEALSKLLSQTDAPFTADDIWNEAAERYARSKWDEACEGCQIHQESFSGDYIIIKPEFKP